eukprot:1036379-Rhodomonas_salina.2
MARQERSRDRDRGEVQRQSGGRGEGTELTNLSMRAVHNGRSNGRGAREATDEEQLNPRKTAGFSADLARISPNQPESARISPKISPTISPD